MILNCDENNRATNKESIDQTVISNSAGSFYLVNYDISAICKGHLSYRGSLDQILEFIDFDF